MQSGLVSGGEINAVITRFKPVYIEGYVSDLLAIPDHANLRDSNIKVVFTTGEMLYESQREELSKKFNARVVSYYGSNEINAIAFECEEGRMHVFDQHVILETLNAEGEQVWEKSGDFYITDLDNQMMPFLRYRIGDRGSLSRVTCACGREGTIIESLEGRTQDKLVNAETGRMITALYLESKFRSFVSLGEMQLVQTGPSSCELLIAEVDISSPEIIELKNHILENLGRPFNITVKSVKEIPLTARGKRSIIRNTLNG
jgi:phenylacetate-CoA ligase